MSHMDSSCSQNNSRPVFRLLTTSIKIVSDILCRVDTTHLTLIPQQGPLILVTNHINFLEVPVVYTHLQPRPLTGFVKAETLKNPILGPLLFGLWGGIPIRRGEADVTAFRLALQALQAGKIVAIAPEGTRSGNGRLQRGHPGSAFLALRSGAPILPLAYYGGERFWKNIYRLRRTDFHIVVGQPFYLKSETDRITRHMRQQMADEIMFQIAALLPPPYRGVYSNLEAATERYLQFPAGAHSNIRPPL